MKRSLGTTYISLHALQGGDVADEDGTPTAHDNPMACNEIEERAIATSSGGQSRERKVIPAQ